MAVELSIAAQDFIKSIKPPEPVRKPKKPAESKWPQAGLDLYRRCDSLTVDPLIECSFRSSYKALRQATWTSPSVETTVDGQKALLVVGATIIEVPGHHMFNYNKYRGVARFFDDDPKKGKEVFLFESHRSGRVCDSRGKALSSDQIERSLEIVQAMVPSIEEWREKCPLPKKYCYMFLKDAPKVSELQHPDIRFL